MAFKSRYGETKIKLHVVFQLSGEADAINVLDAYKKDFQVASLAITGCEISVSLHFISLKLI